MPTLNLLPQPKELTFKTGDFKVPQLGWIVLEDSPAARDLFAGQRLARQLETVTATPWKVVRTARPEAAAPTGKAEGEIRCVADPAIPHDQGYRLIIQPRGVELRARSAAGMFYAMQTLAQIARQNPRRWPVLVIDDAPDFARRGVYHDTARGKVPELGTILQLVDDLASLKINEFQLYVENAYEFRRHPEMYADTTPLTAEEILIIDRACQVRHIDFIPSLTSLGHFEKILNRPAFRKLAEAEPEDLRKQGIQTWTKEPWSLCVTDPAAKAFLRDMYDEFLPNFTSPTFNICCDESWDLGKGRSSALAAEIGTDQLYVDWVNYCAQLTARHGKRIMMWGDIIRNHPEKIAQMPADVTLIEWGYEAFHDFVGRGAVFAHSRRPFYMAPGTSTWQTIAGRSPNALGNIYTAAVAGKQYGALGLLNTDWGDNGHQQLLSISLLPFAYGAEVAWHVPAGKPVGKPAQLEPGSHTPLITDRQQVPGLQNFLRAASIQLFGDPTGQIGKLVYELGTTYQRLGSKCFNAAMEFHLFREAWESYESAAQVKDPALLKTRNALVKAIKKFEKCPLTHPDGGLITRELVFTTLTLIHIIDRTLARRHILGQKKTLPAAALRSLAGGAEDLGKIFEQLWLARNKRSRVDDVLVHFARLAKEYRAAAKSKK